MKPGTSSSTVTREHVGKCRISGPTPDLLHFNKIPLDSYADYHLIPDLSENYVGVPICSEIMCSEQFIVKWPSSWHSATELNTYSPKRFSFLSAILCASQRVIHGKIKIKQTLRANLPHLITLYLHFLPNKLWTGSGRPERNFSNCLFLPMDKLWQPLQAKATEIRVASPWSLRSLKLYTTGLELLINNSKAWNPPKYRI